MNKHHATIVLGLMALLLAACGGNNTIGSNILKGSGNVKLDARDVSGFTSVEVSGSGNLIVEFGDTEALTIEAEDNLLPLLTSEVKDGKLILATKPNSSYSNTKPIIYRLIAKDLESLTVTGSASGTLDNLERDTFNLTVSASGSMNAGVLTVGKLDLRVQDSGRLEAQTIESAEISLAMDNSASANLINVAADTITAGLGAASKATLSGTITSQHITADSSSTYDARNVNSQTVTANADRSGDIFVNVNESLDATARSSSTITYFGDPQELKQSTEASGSIVKG
jgi:hypothetical protein